MAIRTRQANHVLSIATRFEAAGFDTQEALTVLGMLVRFYLARVPEDERADEVEAWSQPFLREPCPFNGHFQADHDHAA